MRTSSQPWALVMALIVATVSFGAAAAGTIPFVSPVSDVLAGGIPVTIKVTGLGAGETPTEVLIGGNPAGTFVYTAGPGAGSGTITCTAPASTTAGVVDIQVRDAAATVLAQRTGGFFYKNNQLIVTVKVNIPQLIAIAWDPTTGLDDATPVPVDHSLPAESVSPYTWFVNLGGRTTNFTQLGTTYASNGTEGRTMAVKNLSPNNRVDINATATDASNGASIWPLAAAPATDRIRIDARSGGNAAVNLFVTSLLTGGTPLGRAGAAAGADVQALVLTFYTPTDATTGLDLDMTSTVTLTASPD